MDAHNARFVHQNKHVKGITGSYKKKDTRSQEWPTKSKEDPQERWVTTSQGNHGAEILNHNFVPKIQSHVNLLGQPSHHTHQMHTWNSIVIFGYK
jgi:hypothetical protein